MLLFGVGPAKGRVADEGWKRATAALIRVLAQHATEIHALRRRLNILEREMQIVKEELYTPTPRKEK